MSRVWLSMLAALLPLRLTYAPFMLIVAAVALLYATSQGAELASAAAELRSLAWFSLAAAAFAWGFLSWATARLVLDDRFGDRDTWERPGPARRMADGDDDPGLPVLPEAIASAGLAVGERHDAALVRSLRGVLRWSLLWTPRFYAAMPYVIATTLAASSVGFLKTGTLLLAAVGLLFVVALWRRREVEALERISERLRDNYGMTALRVVILLVAVVTMVAPLTIGQALGTVAVTFLFLAALLAVMSLVAGPMARWRIPAISLLVLLLGVIALFDPNGHRIRRQGEVPRQRPSLAEQARAWLDRQPDRRSDGSETRRPFVIVTTAGGGITAATWTAALLGGIEERVSGFGGSIFAISGVSGGALGAAVYAAGLASPARDAALTQRITQVMRDDFLGPAFAAFAFNDTFGPLPRALGIAVPDRAAVLETAWEAACESACPAMSGAFHALAPSADAWRPMLVMNGTHVETGKRIITAPFPVAIDAFDDAFDFFHLMGAEIRVSTAVANASRFPYVTPAGMIGDKASEARGHIVDGGYFENFGATTGNEILAASLAALKSHRDRLLPIVIEISSDPELVVRDLVRFPHAKPEAVTKPLEFIDGQDDKPLSALVQLGAPLDALMKTRTARGLGAVTAASRELAEAGGRTLMVTLALCPDTASGEGVPPLGWLLSERTHGWVVEEAKASFPGYEGEPATAGRHADCRDRNEKAMKDLIDALTRPGEVGVVQRPQATAVAR